MIFFLNGVTAAIGLGDFRRRCRRGEFVAEHLLLFGDDDDCQYVVALLSSESDSYREGSGGSRSVVSPDSN